MSREMEDRVRAAFEAKASGIKPTTMRPGEPPAGDDEPSDGVVTGIGHRRRWTAAPLLAAAAVIAVLAGTLGAVTLVRSDRDRTPPAHTQTPTPTYPSPAPHTTPPTTGALTSAPPSSAPPTSAPGSTGSTGKTSAAPTKTVVVQGVGLVVPTTWAVAPTSQTIFTCLTVGGVAYRKVGAADNCQLEILVVAPPVSGGFDPDKPDVIGDGTMCGSGSNTPKVSTITATHATVGGQLAEYRAYTGGCFGGTWEQWVVPTAPGVIIERSQADHATEAAAQFAVTNAQLPGPRSTLRLTDRGFIRSVTAEAGGVRIELDRFTQLMQGGISNTNSATYSYVLPTDLHIVGPTGEPITTQQLSTLAAGRTAGGVNPPLSAYRADLTTDGTRVTGLLLKPQPN